MNAFLTEHVKDKSKHLLKLIAFFQKNKDFPFYVKRKILETAFLPTLLYVCECWLTANVSKVESVYMTAVKALLGVRVTTCNDICLVELGLPPVAAIIKDKINRSDSFKLCFVLDPQ